MRSSFVTFVLLACLTPGAFADVLVVDGAGVLADHYATIQAAVDAAAPGDTVLMEVGINASAETVTIDGKGISLLVDTDNSFVNVRRLSVRNVPAGQRMTVRGMGAQAAPGIPMFFEDNAGVLRLYDLAAKGKLGVVETRTQPARDGSPGAVIENCADVMLRDCGFGGGDGADVTSGTFLAPSNGGPGAEITNSNVTAFFSGIQGGQGGDVEPFTVLAPGGAGGLGVLNDNSTLFFWGQGVSGGHGGDAVTGDGGPGGTGLQQMGGGAAVLSYHGDPVGGTGGQSTSGLDGAAGSAQQLQSGGVWPVNESLPWARDLWSKTPVREGETIELTGIGFDDDFWIVVSLDVLNVPAPDLESALMIGVPFLDFIYLGYVSFVGGLFELGPAPNLPLGLDVAEIQIQAVLQAPGGAFVLGPPEHIVILDASF